MELKTGQQIAAARALLGWDQKDIADRVGLTIAAISKIEKGDNKGKASTLKNIQSVLEMAGIQFTASGGVEPRTDVITVLEGEDAVGLMWDDICTKFKYTGGEVLLSGITEVKESDTKAYAALKDFIKRMQDLNITERILIEEGDTNLVAPDHWYRCLPKSNFYDTHFQVYADTIAMIEWGPPRKLILIRHERFAETFKNLFNIAWDNAKPVVEK